MDTLASMRVFAKVVELENFAEAARRLQMSAAMVTRHIQFLERRIGIRLVNRTTRQFSLTEAGALYHASCIDLLGDIVEAEGRIAELSRTPRGRLRLATSAHFGVTEAWPIARDFMQAYPEIQVDLIINNRHVDLIEEDVDVAIRLTLGQPDPALVTRRLAMSHIIACAAPSYLQRAPPLETPDDLPVHACLNYSDGPARSDWEFSRYGQKKVVMVSSRLHSNDVQVLRDAALDGQGIVRQPSYIVWPYLADGRLQRVLADWQFGELAVSLVYPARKFLPAKTRIFVDFVTDRFVDAAERDIWLDRATGGTMPPPAPRRRARS